MIYLATPYSHPNPRVREQHFEAVCRVAAELLRSGQRVFSPIAHSHSIAKFGLPTGSDFWERHCREQISRSGEAIVLRLAGWEESIGVQVDIGIARDLCLSVQYLKSVAGKAQIRFVTPI